MIKKLLATVFALLLRVASRSQGLSMTGRLNQSADSAKSIPRFNPFA